MNQGITPRGSDSYNILYASLAVGNVETLLSKYQNKILYTHSRISIFANKSKFINKEHLQIVKLAEP